MIPYRSLVFHRVHRAGSVGASNSSSSALRDHASPDFLEYVFGWNVDN